ncbi:MAG: ABC transporter permease [Anaerococcus sp.]|nr:ABC transporter permease [Anaerococcus sp.]
MKIRDRLELSLRNLSRRKSRTILTVLSVVIGATSIILMLAFSLGINKQQREFIDSFSSLTSIQILTEQSGGKTKIDDATINKLKQIPGVKVVVPSKNIMPDTFLKNDEDYALSSPMEVMPDYVMKELTDDMFEWGNKPLASDDKKIILGPQVNIGKKESYGDGSYTFNPVEDFDYKGKDFIIRLGYKDDQDDDGVNFTPTDQEGGEVKSTKPNFIDIPVQITGKLNTKSFVNSWSIIINESLYKRLIKEEKKIANPSLGLSYNDNGEVVEPKNKDAINYENLRVIIDNPKDLENVDELIKDQGFETRSEAGATENLKKTSLVISLIFGAIGSVAFIVSAIGIINTMLMSIYERQKEIGVMKVIGASIKDIRSMFLIESGFIGFFGGLIGLIISLLVGLAINKVISMGGDINQIIVIPPWLALLGVGFSSLVGVLAGYVPARRATKLSAIEVLRSN